MSDHDPMCPLYVRKSSRMWDCICEALREREARVRADERERLIECIETAGCGICGKSYTQIEAEVRERIAQEIEADCDHMSSGVYEDASLNDVCPVCARCAAVARGGESDG